MSNRLGGSARGSSYLGTNAVQPPDCVFSAETAPTQYDINHSLLDLWLNQQTQIVYILVSLAGDSNSAGPLATWIALNGSSGSAISEVIADSGIPVLPTGLGEIFAFGGSNINTQGSTNTLSIYLNDSIFLPATTADMTAGVIGIGTGIAVQMIGVNNIFLGTSGNFTLSGSNNTGAGQSSLQSLTTGSNNSSFGVGSGSQIETGSNNIFLGYNAGSDLTGNDSSNIIIGNTGQSGDLNIIRIGTAGIGAGQQSSTYVAGVYANTGTLDLDNGVVQSDLNGLLKSTRGTNGQLLIGGTGTGPVWDNLTSVGGTIAISNGSGTINLEATGGGTAINCAFLAQNTPNVPNVTGDGTVYTYGTTQALVERFDVGNNFNPATGVFTAPTDSQYYLEITVDLTNTDADAGNNVIICTAQIITTARTYTWNLGGSSYFSAGGGISGGTISFQQIVDMSAGDTATFTIATDMSGGGGNKVIGLGAGAFVSGYLVSGAGVGILQVDTDSGSASPVMGILEVFGGDNISTEAIGANTVVIHVADTTDHALQVGNATGSLTSLAAATDGQIPIGSTGVNPVMATITAGTNITVTNGAGSITIAATGGGGGTTWNAVAGTTQAMVVNNGYYTQNAGLTTATLPVTAAAGTIIEVAGVGAGGWRIAQNAGQSIGLLGSTTTIGVGGSLSSVEARANIKILCVVDDTLWVALPYAGNFTLV